MFDTSDRLAIFESFRVDRQLLKFMRPKTKSKGQASKASQHGTEDGFVGNDESDGEEGRFFVTQDSSNVTFSIRNNSTLLEVRREGSKSSRWKFWRWRRRVAVTSVEMSVPEFFRSVKNSTEQLVVVDSRAAGYEAAMMNAVRMGQTALKEQLQKGLVATRAEAQLVAMGQGKYIEEASVVAFAKKSSKAVRLDWIANFVRMIPESLQAVKRDADARFIFDNYVVMHHDPTGKSWAETQAERAQRERDPILFGVIEGRRRLYYLGDWTDEFCDLTLDQVADSLGKDAVKTV
jgi:hypothetical protein